MRIDLFLTFSAVFFVSLNAQPGRVIILPEENYKVKPWTGIAKHDLGNSEFRFAIVADRTGGMQPGIFKKAMQKLNLLQPEFVVSVGDLIEGYTTNEDLANAEWDEFEEMVSVLTMPFFYLPGNHDFTNQVMKDIWQKRFGQSYYYFLYNNVLFLCLNTEDDNFNGLSAEQVVYFKNVLIKNGGVRWTFVFMHTPLWDYKNPRGYEKIEAALQGRDYTLFSGHHHNYVKKTKADKKHFVLATTGGGSSLRGAEFGELHHLVWVTMGADSPVIANLALDGIYDEDLVEEEDYSLVQTLRNGNWLEVKPLVAEQNKTEKLQTELVIKNPVKRPLQVTGTLEGRQGLIFEPQKIELTIPAETEQSLNIMMTHEDDMIQISTLDPVVLTLDGAYLDSRGQTLKLPASRTLLMDWKHTCLKQNVTVTVDGLFNEWEGANWLVVKHPQDFDEEWDWHGAEDGRFKIATSYDNRFLFIALEACDDIIHTGIQKRTDLQDRLTIFLKSEDNPNFQTVIEISPLGSGKCDVHQKNDPEISGIRVGCRVSDHIIKAEVAIPRSNPGLSGNTFRLNVAFKDHDNPNNTKPSILYWRPVWGSSLDYAGSGVFILQ